MTGENYESGIGVRDSARRQMGLFRAGGEDPAHINEHCIGIMIAMTCDCDHKCPDGVTMERRHGTPDQFKFSVYAAVPGKK